MSHLNKVGRIQNWKGVHQGVGEGCGGNTKKNIPAILEVEQSSNGYLKEIARLWEACRISGGYLDEVAATLEVVGIANRD